MILFEARCSSRWAVHPAVRAMTKSGVKKRVGIPHCAYADAA